jgi:iron uptake system EfeUOB component EfeO/EfeM
VTQNMTVTLEAGEYELICYLDDSPRGTLTVQ